MSNSLIFEGKTKRISIFQNNENLCIVESKNTITANDDPDLTREFETKAKAANITTSNIFDLLKNEGVPVAFKKKISNTEFLADKCIMIPLEVIARRYAVGSYLKRQPELMVKEGDNPFKFNELCIEFFLKTTNGKCIFDNKELISGLTVEDPFIGNPEAEIWKLFEPKIPFYKVNAFLNDFDSSQILGNAVSIEKLKLITIQVFTILEKAWKEESCILVDFKIEFGINSDGKLVVSDVIDNDSWRLRTNDWDDLSKQSFRDGESLTKVEKKYLQVMEMTNNFVK